MKAAREWAESVVTESAWIEDSEAAVAMCQASQVEKARAIIERLVERVQADVRAAVEEEIARLRAENGRLNAEHTEYREFIAISNDMLAEEHERARRLGE